MDLSERLQTMMTTNDGLLHWLLAIAIALAVTSLLKFVLKVFNGRLRTFSDRTSFAWDDIVAASVAETRSWFIFLMVLAFIVTMSDPPKHVLSAVQGVVVFAVCLQVIIWGLRGIREWHGRVLEKKIENSVSSAAAMNLIYSAMKALMIVAVVLIGLSNLGVDIGALIAGLGIGGIAIALAAQNVLGDLLASLSIVLDKPFVIKDYIVVGKEEGEVEAIGIKTTRVRSISGEELIFSNKDLLESRVRNYKRMWRRRVVQKFSVSENTPLEKMAAIPKWVRDLFPAYPKLTFDRCHLVGHGEGVVNYELVFWVADTSYLVYMDLQEQLLLEIFRKFQQEDVRFGFPVQELRIDQPLKTEIERPKHTPKLASTSP